MTYKQKVINVFKGNHDTILESTYIQEQTKIMYSRRALLDLLNSLVNDGKLICVEYGKYKLKTREIKSKDLFG